MSTPEAQDQNATVYTPRQIRIPLDTLTIAIWQRRGFLLKVAGVGLLLALGYALLSPNQYQSTAQLMPPNQQSLTNISTIDMLEGGANLGPGMMGSLVSGRSPGATTVGILKSRVAQDDLINRFDLLRVFHVKFYEEARKRLADETTVEEDKTTGILKIVVVDRDRYRARDIASAYIEELNKLLNTINSSSSRREREFLEQRLKGLKTELDASSRALSQFSSRNATFSPRDQGQEMMAAAASLQGQLIVAQSDLSSLKAIYSDDNMRVKGARAKVGELQAQLNKMGAVGQKNGATDLKDGELFPTIREIPLLGVTYSDLYMQLTMQETLYTALSKQYELAKVEEAKEIPTVKVLDPPDLPERKSLPHRAIITIAGTFIAGFLGILWIICGKLWEMADNSNPIKTFVRNILSAVRPRKSGSPA